MPEPLDSAPSDPEPSDPESAAPERPDSDGPGSDRLDSELPDRLRAEGALDEFKSRSQKKREASALQALGAKLASLPEADLAHLPLDAELREALAECRRLTRQARNRQVRRIAQLLRLREIGEVERWLERSEQHQRRAVAEEHVNETWRRRLLEQGDAALSELLAAYPGADRGHLRGLVRRATAEGDAPRAVRARRELLRAIRELRQPAHTEPATEA